MEHHYAGDIPWRTDPWRIQPFAGPVLPRRRRWAAQCWNMSADRRHLLTTSGARLRRDFWRLIQAARGAV